MHGDVLGSPGHVRVEIAADVATVDYVRANVPGVGRRRRPNREVAYSYEIRARSRP